MTTKTYLQLAKPCNEDWNKMTKAQKGRFCDSCATQVTDFTLMKDDEVLKYLALNDGSMCGRIHKDQLERAMNDIHKNKKQYWQILVAGFASLFFSIGKGFTQPKKLSADVMNALLVNNKPSNLFNAVSNQSITIKGKIVNDENKALLSAQVTTPNSLQKIMVNKKGNFVMQVNSDISAVLVAANGFNSRVVPVNMLQNNDTTIVLNATDTSIAPISGFDKGDLNGTNIIMGGITSFTDLDKKDTIVTFVKKIFNNSFFKILPNPANTSGVSISVKQEGAYTIQIFDNNSTLIHVQQITVNTKGQVVQIAFPNCMVKGSYFIRVIDKKTKKQYVDKLIVQ